MSIDQWWPRLEPSTRKWLINNNGTVVPPEVLEEITAAAGGPAADAPWAWDEDSAGFLLTDEAVDWIEAAANGEESVQD